MRTPQTDSPAKEKLLDAAQSLMLVKGFTATTVDEICETAGLTKGSFFHYFESKDDLGRTVLDRFVSSRWQAIQQGPFREKRDPLQRLYGCLDFMIEMSKHPAAPGSCLLGNFAQELSATHPQIRSQCAAHFARWSEAFKRDLDEAKRTYAPRSSIDTQSLAEHFIAVLQGALILDKAKQERGQVEAHIRHFQRYLKSLFER
jgi:TetR/AcrR family transcriptional repressor of nem operon